MPRHYRPRKDETSTKKIVLLLGMLFVLTSVTSVMLTAFPQHLVLTKNTTIGAVKFLDGNHAIVRGNQVSYSTGDIIPVDGRGFIRVTGKQIQISGSETYKEGIRSIPAGWQQNPLFLQKIGTFNTTVAQMLVDNAVINIIYLSDDIININAVDIRAKNKANSYNVQLQGGVVYLNEHGAMIKLVKENGHTKVFLVGTARYDRIILRSL